MRFLFDFAIAATAYLLADTTVKIFTDRHIHEHAFQWWCELRDQVSCWLQTHRHLQVAQIGIAVLDKIDGFAVWTKRTVDKITLRTYVVDRQAKQYKIKTIVVADDVSARFLRKNTPTTSL